MFPSTLTILGCSGFIGSHLVERLLGQGGYHIYGIDLTSTKISHLLDNPNFTFTQSDIHKVELIRPFIEKSDIIISLVALCNPALYNTIPIDVINVNFTKPLAIVEMCAEFGTHLIQFSTSEVYGKTIAGLVNNPEITKNRPDLFMLSEDETPLLLGPISAQRWSYASAKQLLERAIYAYGFQKNLSYTIVRPFNFIGPRMDFIPGIDGDGIPRVLACFMDALMFNKPLLLVDGGHNRRTFTYIDDAIDAIEAMIVKHKEVSGQIFNIGNTENEISIRDLAYMMVEVYKDAFPNEKQREIEIREVSSSEFYGKGYEDSDRRVPYIAKAQNMLNWQPKVKLRDALLKTVKAYVEHYRGI